MNNNNSSISIFGFSVAILSGGMSLAGFEILTKDKINFELIALKFIGGSMFIGGIYLFVPTNFRSLWTYDS